MTERVVLLVVPDDAESRGAARWVQGQVVGAEVVGDAARLRGARVIWCHAGERVPVFSADVMQALREALESGAHLVLSLLATPLAQALGAPGVPRVELPRVWRHEDDPQWPAAFRDWPGYPHIRGFQGWGRHPLLEGFERGTYTWMARAGDHYTGATLPRAEWGDGVGVIAVDRSYVHLDATTAVAWESEVGLGRVLCLGAHTSFTGGDELLHAQRDHLLRNALRQYATLTGVYWPGGVVRHARVSPLPRPRALGSVGEWTPPEPRAINTNPAAAPWTLGAPLGLAVGNEGAGVQELWLHPLLVVGGGVQVVGTGEVKVTRVSTSGFGVERWLRCGDGEWREVVVSSRSAPEWVFELQPVTGSEPIALELLCPMRLQWPMPAELLRPLRTEQRTDGRQSVVVITGCDGRHALAIYIDGAHQLDVLGDDAAPRVRVTGAPGEGIRMLFRASVNGVSALTMRESPIAAIIQEQSDENRRRTACHTTLETASPQLDSAWVWATTRLAGFLSGATGEPAGLMAGYAATRSGWGESRPGYAWHFGRDTFWCVDAMLASGMFEEARVAIDRLASTADVTGKIAHEITTNGVAHYDAADATPLFIRAVTAWGEWTGDREALERWWPAVRAAYAFVRTCDRDDDGLPGNDGVGHGWIEMGPLGGGSVTSYVAAIWIDALRRLAPLARVVGDHTLAHDAAAQLDRALGAFDALRLPNGHLALHRTVDGRLEGTTTALSAVPSALGLDASSTGHAVLDQLATEAFTTPWGVRMLSRHDARYQPRGYHTGAVWPLFTGWAALANARLGHLDRALDLVRSIADCSAQRTLGAFDEVLDGDTGDAAGVCPDQAWSAAALISPMVHGILCLRPDAMNGECTIDLRLPDALDTLQLHGIRVGTTRFRGHWVREDGAVRAQLTHLSGPALRVRAMSTYVTIGAANPTARLG